MPPKRRSPTHLQHQNAAASEQPCGLTAIHIDINIYACNCTCMARCVCVCCLFIWHIYRMRIRNFFMMSRAHGAKWLPRFKMIASLAAVDRKGGRERCRGRSKTGAASAYNILLFCFCCCCRLALRISLFSWICLKISRCLPDLRTITVSGILNYWKVLHMFF